jgi:transcriptional regulator
MYVPSSFARRDDRALRELIRARGFATVITAPGGVPFASHLPLLLDGDVLVGHMARANPQWRHFDGATEVLAVFHGPHAYISPVWYEAPEHVPTWNYAVVHAYGVPRIVEGERAREVLAALVEAYEPTPWRIGDLAADKLGKLLGAIVAFELPIARLEGKWKVGQNREPAERASAAAHLRAQGGEDAEAVATLMLDTLAREP